jgi:hypothetical protein
MQELHDDGVDAAADKLWNFGTHFHWWKNQSASWRDSDPIGRSEFGGLVQEIISTYLETAASREGDGQLRYRQPRLVADISLYSTEKGGEELKGFQYGCSCKFDPADVSGWDGFISLGDQQLAPGETKRLDISFAISRVASMFRILPKFYLWRDRIIGEAVPVSGPFCLERDDSSVQR